jgi:hypothetical protein
MIRSVLRTFYRTEFKYALRPLAFELLSNEIMFWFSSSKTRIFNKIYVDDIKVNRLLTELAESDGAEEPKLE